MPDPAPDLPAHYNRRAAEYEQIWRRADPVRQREQAAMVAVMRELFAGRRVLEVACGTGWWTERIAEVTTNIVAVDAAPEMLALARLKRLSAERVQFHLGDAYVLAEVPGSFEAGLANFWLSHVPRTRVAEFLQGFHARLNPGAVVFLADNVFVPGLGGELVRRPGWADTFKRRTLADGWQHDVLKNYYSAAQLQELFTARSTGLKIHEGECFWWLSYQVLPA